jgi:predicted nucleotidyltransferase
MKTFEEIRKILQTQKTYLAQKYGIREIGIFGSYVRNEQRADSDLGTARESDRRLQIGRASCRERVYVQV